MHETSLRETEAAAVAQNTRDRKEWEEPKLAFVEPMLTRQGELKELTGGFFGSFSP